MASLNKIRICKLPSRCTGIKDFPQKELSRNKLRRSLFMIYIVTVKQNYFSWCVPSLDMHESIFIGELSYLANLSVLVLYNFTSGVNEVINILSYFYLGIIIYKSEYYLFIYFYKKHQFGLFECAKMPW